MSQHAINHSFRGTDSLLAKWNGLIGKGVKEEKKNPFWGQFPVSASADRICTPPPPRPAWWVVFRLKNVALGTL